MGNIKNYFLTCEYWVVREGWTQYRYCLPFIAYFCYQDLRQSNQNCLAMAALLYLVPLVIKRRKISMYIFNFLFDEPWGGAHSFSKNCAHGYSSIVLPSSTKLLNAKSNIRFNYSTICTDKITIHVILKYFWAIYVPGVVGLNGDDRLNILNLKSTFKRYLLKPKGLGLLSIQNVCAHVYVSNLLCWVLVMWSCVVSCDLWLCLVV